jgi:uncharacterized membrane protein
MESFKRTLALFGIVVGAIFVFNVFYDLFWRGIVDPLLIGVAALVVYAIINLDRRFVRSFWEPVVRKREAEQSEPSERE